MPHWFPYGFFDGRENAFIEVVPSSQRSDTNVALGANIQHDTWATVGVVRSADWRKLANSIAHMCPSSRMSPGVADCSPTFLGFRNAYNADFDEEGEWNLPNMT